MLPGRSYLMRIGTQLRARAGHQPQAQGRRQHPRAHRRQDARAQRDRPVQSVDASAGCLRSLRGESRNRRLHPDRPLHQRHGRRRHDLPSACAAPPTSIARALLDRQGGARAPQRPQPAILWFTGLSGSGKSHHREYRGAGAARARRAHLPAGRRQRAPRSESRSRLHRCRPRREHPPRGRGGAPVRRCRRLSCSARSSRRSAPSAAWCASSSPRASSSRSTSIRRSRSACAAIPKGLYARALAGKIKNFTGIDSPYEAPTRTPRSSLRRRAARMKRRAADHRELEGRGESLG